ncbi:unnamed protein product [Moneuplotes crassus]|uniref:Uncharacterized protein n=1 Tax=Euplotes crassus TaxID=5936 RepID=A0AAD1UDD7_EUPCR|nr:unnamed protein product [Moneuplotes crassus]
MHNNAAKNDLQDPAVGQASGAGAGPLDWASKYVGEQSNLPIILSILYRIAIIIFGIITLIMAIMAYVQLNAYSNALEDFEENWTTLPLVDITVSTTECPLGYDNLIEREWPGTVHGCDCKRAVWGFSIYPDLDTGSCSYNQTLQGCVDVYPVDSAPLDKFYSAKICGLREGQNFVDTERPRKIAGGIKCPFGHKPCGTGDINQIICVREQERCPINDVQILMNGQAPKPGYEVVPIDSSSGVMLAFTTNYTGLPVIRFKLTEGQVCANPDTDMITEGRIPYKLLNTNNYHSCNQKVSDSYYDTRYDLIGSINEERLLKDNGLYLMLSNLPQYPIEDSSKYTWNLYSNEYNYWNVDCENHKDIDRESMLSLLDDSSNVTKLQFTLLIVSIIYTIVCCLILETISLYMICDKGSESKSFQVISFSIVTILLMVKTYLFWSCVSTANEFEESILQMRESDCSSDYANLMFKNYGDSLIDGRSSNYTGMILSMISLVLTIIFFFIEMGKRSMYDVSH